MNIGSIEVDNPFYHPDASEHRRIRAVRTLRDDPLGQMHDRRQINEAQYQAGREWQRNYERARIGYIQGPATQREAGTEALRYAEPVWGSRKLPAGVTDAQMAAYDKLKAWKAALGSDGYWLIHTVLANKRSLREAANMKHVYVNEATLKYVGRRFRESLDCLARVMGYA